MNIPAFAVFLLAAGWPQFGHDPAHSGAVTVPAQPMQKVIASVVMDPFVAAEESYYQNDLLVHYATPVVDGDDVFIEVKSGTYAPANWSTQTWGVQAFRWQGDQLVQRWTSNSDWKPIPYDTGGPLFEPVFQPVLANGFLYMPGAGGSVLRVDRDTGAIVDRLGSSLPLDAAAFVSGPLVFDAAGNIDYNVIAAAVSGNPWANDVRDAWLEQIAPDGSSRRMHYAAMVTGAPSQCRGVFTPIDLPWPPSPDAVPSTVPCGSQRPGVNVAPAIAQDGTIYTVSRSHLNSRYGFLVALNADLTLRWSASLRDRFHDGCNVLVPPNGTIGGCRIGAITGVDPEDNTAGAGRVLDESSSMPLAAPDGSVLYGAYTRYNFQQGHLMHFDAAGNYLGAYPFGWDITPGIRQHENTYSIITKENHYTTGSYCDDPTWCPVTNSGKFLITALDPSLHAEWSTNAPRGFEWCINGPAIDANGVSYVNSEDGWLYSINSDGTLRQSIQLSQSLGQAYTPVVIDGAGRVYAEKAGTLFVVGSGIPPRRRAVK